MLLGCVTSSRAGLPLSTHSNPRTTSPYGKQPRSFPQGASRRL